MTSKLVDLHESLIRQSNTTIQKEPFKPVIFTRKILWFFCDRPGFIAGCYLPDHHIYFVQERQKHLKEHLF